MGWKMLYRTLLVAGAGLAFLLLFQARTLRDSVRVNELALQTTRMALVPGTMLETRTEGGKAQVVYFRGLQSLWAGDSAAAIAAFQSLSPQWRQPVTGWLLVQVLASSNDIVRASATLGEMNLDTDTLVGLARGLPAHENDSLRQLLAEQALHQGQGSIDSRRWLGLWSLANSNPRQAIEIIEPIISPEDHYLWSQLGWGYYILGDYTQAVEAFKRSWALTPEDPLYRLRLAQAYQARNGQGDREQARVLLEDLVSEDAGASVETWYTLGWNYYISNRGVDAVAAFERVVGMEPNNSLYQLRLAQALVLRSEGNDRMRAIALLQKAVAQSPNFTEAANLLQSLTSPGQ